MAFRLNEGDAGQRGALKLSVSAKTEGLPASGAAVLAFDARSMRAGADGGPKSLRLYSITKRDTTSPVTIHFCGRRVAHRDLRPGARTCLALDQSKHCQRENHRGNVGLCALAEGVPRPIRQ